MAKNYDRNWSDPWAYDLDIDVFKNGEVWDDRVIDQSIESILSTNYGERLFNPSFGSRLPLSIFSELTPNSGERLLDDVAEALKIWEDRITVIESEMRLEISNDHHTIRIVIPYIIKSRNIKSVFQRNITV